MRAIEEIKLRIAEARYQSGLRSYRRAGRPVADLMSQRYYLIRLTGTEDCSFFPFREDNLRVTETQIAKAVKKARERFSPLEKK